jgi:hypothetical protein
LVNYLISTDLSIVDIDTEEVYRTRQATLMQYWNFTCQCSLCRKPATQIASSDERLRTIKKLQEKLHDWTQFGPEHIKMAEKLVALYVAEQLWTSPMRHQAAAYAYSILGDATRTVIHATKALRAVKLLDWMAYDWIHDLEKLIVSCHASFLVIQRT